MATKIGTGADDVLEGTWLADGLYGQGGNDLLKGLDGDDRLYGEDGNDRLAGGYGNDVMDGGAGRDKVTWYFDDYGEDGRQTGVNVDLAAGTASSEGEQDTLRGIEEVFTSPLSDILKGDAASNTLWGVDGDDRIDGLDGKDVLYGGNGADTLTGSLGDDTLDGGPGFDRASWSLEGSGGVTVDLALGRATRGTEVDALAGIEHVTGSRFDDMLLGGTGTDTLHGAAGGDMLRGRGGDDKLFGEAGDDTLDGGVGYDTADWGDGRGGVLVDLATGAARRGGEQDAVSSIEAALGTAGTDTLLGNTDGNRLEGRAGADRLDGRSGNDYLDGGGGDDALLGGAGNDFLFDPAGSDTHYGGDGADAMYGGADDRSYGGNGDDYFFTYGHAEGGAGNDLFDFTRGRLSGGPGADTFMLNGAGGRQDRTIADFSRQDGDRISLALWDANNDPADGNQAWTFVGTAPFSGPGQVRYQSLPDQRTLVQASFDGAGAPDLALVLEGRHVLTEDGFNLGFATTGNDDAVIGTPLADYIDAGGGDDTIDGGAGQDHLYGGDGRNLIRGGAGNDDVRGGGEAGRLYGGPGDDAIQGWDGPDYIDGGPGDDRIYGSAGRDELIGGEGRDLFSFSAQDSGIGADRDVIRDFGAGDLIDLGGAAPETARWFREGLSYTFVGTAPFTGPDQVRYVASGSRTVVQASDESGPGLQFEIELAGSHKLTNADFIL